MSGFLLDTSIASVLEPSRSEYSMPFIEWTRSHDSEIYLSTITFFEIGQGIAKLRRLASLPRAESIKAWQAILAAAFFTRTLGVDSAVAEAAGDLSDYGHSIGRHPGLADILIAATAQVHGLTLLTRNVRHFEPLGIEVIDPLVTLPG